MAKTNKIAVVEREPSYAKEEASSQADIREALSWYNENKDEKDAAKYLNCGVKHAKNNLTYAWIVRMLSRGFKLPETTQNYVNELKVRFDTLVEDEVDENGNVIVEQKGNVINLQERISAKTDQHLGELEGMIDEYGFGEKAFNAYDWFIKNDVKPIHANRIGEYFRNRAKEILSFIEGKDKECRQAYTSIGKSTIKSILSVMTTIVKDSERLALNVNKTRKPRKRKVISADKLVSKLKYKAKDDSFKIQSINPETILGSSQLWVFNTKTRRLAVYFAKDADGLSLKGSTLKNFNEDTSISKTLRKPEKILTSVLEGGKISLRKVMDGINGKSYEIQGRINKDCVILRAVP
jgi:hypothetical protein